MGCGLSFCRHRGLQGVIRGLQHSPKGRAFRHSSNHPATIVANSHDILKHSPKGQAFRLSLNIARRRSFARSLANSRCFPHLTTPTQDKPAASDLVLASQRQHKIYPAYGPLRDRTLLSKDLPHRRPERTSLSGRINHPNGTPNRNHHHKFGVPLPTQIFLRAPRILRPSHSPSFSSNPVKSPIPAGEPCRLFEIPHAKRSHPFFM